MVTWARAQRRAFGLPSDLLQQRIGGGGEQDAKLVGSEARATGAVEFQTMMQFFDAILEIGSWAKRAASFASA